MDVDDAKRVLEEEKQQRVQKCVIAIAEILEANNCEIIAVPNFLENGGKWEFVTSVHVREKRQ